MSEHKYGICGICYHSPGCGVIVHFDQDQHIERLAPDPQAPSGKVLCPMADSVREILYGERRLRQPLKRVGPKGTHDFEPIGWDQAFDIIVTQLQGLKERHGAESVGFYAGTGSYERSFRDAFQLQDSQIYLASSVLFPFGSPNSFGVGAPCYTALGVLAPQLTMGCLHTDMFSDVDNADLIVVWGTDPSTATPPEMFQRLAVAAREGADIIVIDPRKTAAAELEGSRWLPIRPGSDGALALGLSHILIRDHLYDADFVEKWTIGFAEFAAYVQEFTPTKVARLTGIDPQRIERLAQSIAQAEGATYVMYTGLEYTQSGVQNIRAVMVLWALAGQLDVPGGRCFARRENRISLCRDHQVPTPGFERSIGRGRFPVYAHYCGGEPHASLLPKAIIEGDPYKIRAMLICGASLITAWPDPALWRKALGELEFLVTMDLQLTADAAYADIVLPVTTAFEQASYCYYGNALRWRDRLIEPLGQARPDYDILVELADRLGYGQIYPRTRQELLQKLLHGSGFTLEDVMQADKQVIQKATVPMEYRKWEKGLLRADGQPGFQTPSGKFEIKSTVLDQYGHDGLPHYEESWETAFSDPRLAEKYPLILGTGPFKPDMKSCLRAIPGFIAKYPHPIVQLHPQDAEPRGIADGDQVNIKTARGAVLMRAQVTDKIMPGFAYAQVGGGGPLGPPEWQQANANTLTDMAQFDPISGFPVYKTLLCQIAKKKRTRKGIAVQDPSLGCVG